MKQGCKCAEIVHRVKREREAVYCEIWERVMSVEKRMILLVFDATCCHTQLCYNMYSWMCVSFLNILPSRELQELKGKVCTGVGCKQKDEATCLRMLSMLKSHNAVVMRMHVRHRRMLALLHDDCADMIWSEVDTLRTPIRDLSQIIYHKLDEKFLQNQAPMQALSTNPHNVVHAAIAEQRHVSAAKNAAWQQWRAWFLNRIRDIKKRREENAQKLLITINW